MQFLTEIHRADAHLISGEVIYVNADPASKTSAPVPAFLREAVAGFERVSLTSGV
jgi:acyl-CoA thioester hydrolase